MNNLQEIIEVILPFHRVDKYLVWAINSVKSSTNISVRIIAVNDTGSYVEPDQLNLEDSDLLLQTTKRGYINALKVGVEASSSRYVAFVDSDDLIHPQKIYNQLNLLKSQNLDFVSCGIQKMNSQNRIRKGGSLLGKVPPTSNVRELWIIGSHGADSTLLCRGHLLRQFWSNHQKFEPHFADYGWALSLPEDIKFGQLQNKFYFYRSHSGQISKSPALGDSWKSIYPFWVANLTKVFPDFPKEIAPSEREALAIAFPASMIKLNRNEIRNLVKFEKILKSYLKDRNFHEKLAWKTTMARRLFIASRGSLAKYWYVAPCLAWSVISLKFSGFRFRKISSEN